MRKLKLYNDNIAHESSLNEGGFFWALLYALPFRPGSTGKYRGRYFRHIFSSKKVQIEKAQTLAN